MMNVLYYQVGQEPVVKEIAGDLQSMQKLVGGYIEVVRLPELPMLNGQYFAIVDEEGLLKEKPVVNRGQLVGDLFLVANDENEEGEFRGLTDEEVDKLKVVMDVLLPKAVEGATPPAPSMTYREW